MQLTDCFLDAFNTVLAWELPDEAYADAIAAQACLMAGVDREQFGPADLN